MSAELFTTTASAWTLFLVAGLGIAALPWTARELQESVGALRALTGVLAAPLRRARPEPLPEPVPVSSGC